MLEGCVTVLYTIASVFFTLVFVLASLGGLSSYLRPVDSIWGLLLTMACAVWLASMLLSTFARRTTHTARAAAGWPCRHAVYLTRIVGDVQFY